MPADSQCKRLQLRHSGGRGRQARCGCFKLLPSLSQNHIWRSAGLPLFGTASRRELHNVDKLQQLTVCAASVAKFRSPYFIQIAELAAGVVGLAAARALALTGRKVLVVERADAVGTGTSSRNSEIIHAGKAVRE